MTSAMPPRWAEALLRLVLDSRDQASVSGDLLEEFRDLVWSLPSTDPQNREAGP